MRDRLRESGGALTLYTLLVLASFYPQSFRAWDTVAYIGDPLDTVYFMGWNARQFFRDPLHLFDANILHPTPNAMALAGHRILLGVLLSPVIALTGNPVFAYNVAIGLGCLLAAMSGRHLGRALGLDRIGAWAAGALYGFHTYQINEAPRADLMWHGFLTLALGELVRYFKTGERRRAWTVAGLMVLQGLASNYLVLYGALLLTLVTLAGLIVRPTLMIRRLSGLVTPAVVAAALFAPVVLPHVRAARVFGFARELPMGIDLEYYVSTNPSNLLYGQIGAPAQYQQRLPHFIGFLSIGLALFALVAQPWCSQREPPALLPSRAWVPSAAALALLFVALSLGRDAVLFNWEAGPGPYRLLHRWVPGFSLVRIPQRFGLIAMLFVSLLVGWTLSFLVRARLPRLALVLAAIVPLEHLSPLSGGERIPVTGDVPEVYRWLKGVPATAVIEVPIHGEGLVRMETIQEYFSVYHSKPIVHGYVSYPPLLSVILRRMADEFPSDRSLQALQRVGVDTVIVHEGWPRSHRLYGEVREAVAAGRIVPQGHFGRAYRGTADAAYRIVPGAHVPSAPLPRGRREIDPGWRYYASASDPLRASDGDLSTAWQLPGELNGDEFFEIAFGRGLRVSGVVIPLATSSTFPTGMRLEGRDSAGNWTRLGGLDDRHLLQLVDQLVAHPGAASLGFDLGGRELAGVRLRVGPLGASFDGWNMSECEVWVQ